MTKSEIMKCWQLYIDMTSNDLMPICHQEGWETPPLWNEIMTAFSIVK